MHLIDKDPTKKPQGAPNTGKGGMGLNAKASALKNKIIGKTSDVLSAPARKYHAARSVGYNRKYHAVKDIQAKLKSGVASNKDRAVLLQMKEGLNKK